MFVEHVFLSSLCKVTLARTVGRSSKAFATSSRTRLPLGLTPGSAVRRLGETWWMCLRIRKTRSLRHITQALVAHLRGPGKGFIVIQEILRDGCGSMSLMRNLFTQNGTGKNQWTIAWIKIAQKYTQLRAFIGLEENAPLKGVISASKVSMGCSAQTYMVALLFFCFVLFCTNIKMLLRNCCLIKLFLLWFLSFGLPPK